jgi:hypothetical protein
MGKKMGENRAKTGHKWAIGHDSTRATHGPRDPPTGSHMKSPRFDPSVATTTPVRLLERKQRFSAKTKQNCTPHTFHVVLQNMHSFVKRKLLELLGGVDAPQVLSGERVRVVET